MSEPRSSSEIYLKGSASHQRDAPDEKTSIPEAASSELANGAQSHDQPHNVSVNDDENGSIEWMPVRQGAHTLSSRFELATPATLDQRFSYGLNSSDNDCNESQRARDNASWDDTNVEGSGDSHHDEPSHGEVTIPSAVHGTIQVSRHDGSDGRDDGDEEEHNADTTRTTIPRLSPSQIATHLDKPHVEPSATSGQAHSSVENHQLWNIRSTATETHESASAIQTQEIPSQHLINPLQQRLRISPGLSTIHEPQVLPALPPPLHGRPWGVQPAFVPPPVPPPTWGMLAPPRRRRRDIFLEFLVHPIKTLRDNIHRRNRPASTPSLPSSAAPRNPTPPLLLPSPQSRPPSPLLPPIISPAQAASEYQQFVLAGGWTPWSQRAQIAREVQISQPTASSNYYTLAEAESFAAAEAHRTPRPILPQPSVQRAPIPTQLERQQQQTPPSPSQRPQPTRSASPPPRIQGPRTPPPSPAWMPPPRIARSSVSSVNSAWLLPPSRPSHSLSQRQQAQAQTRNNSVTLVRPQTSLPVLHEIEGEGEGEEEGEGGENLRGRPHRVKPLGEIREDAGSSGMEKLKGVFSRKKDRGV